MAPSDDIQVGDSVNVPGGMHGTIKFLGSVAGKQGRFAGVELAPEHAGKGKNSGDVDGRSYFTTSIPGSGIFVPMNNSKYVTKRAGAAAVSTTPPTPSRPAVTNFSKSVGPGASASVGRPRLRRPSLPRAESPRAVPPPKLNIGGLRTPSTFNRSSPANGGPKTPLRTPRPSSRPSSRISVEETPTSTKRSEFVKTPVFDDSENAEKVKLLENKLRDRDRQLEEQAATLAEFQKSITELEGSDALQVRAQLREKNEKIAALTAEFDGHRADFRSTLDTLEVAASETERVYERRLEELIQANRELQDRGEDVEAVAQQLKQLEELVSELEEGLEDARRGEAEARGEVEFLRGEVERARLELKQEREKSGSKNNGSPNESTSKDLDQKDDEIRGLKAIIHSLSRGDPSNTALSHTNGDSDRISGLEHRIQELESLSERKSYRIEELERGFDVNQTDQSRLSRNRSGTITSLKQRHISAQSSNGSPGSVNHTHTLSDRTVVPNDHSEPQNNGNGRHSFTSQRRSIPNDSRRRLEAMQESDAHSSSTDDGTSLWCEICETSGHDILTCTNMFGSGAGNTSNSANAGSKNNQGKSSEDQGTPKDNHQGDSIGRNGLKAMGSPSSSSQRTGREAVLEGLKGIGGLSNSLSPIAGKSSGVIDETKWCALCERDGHESIDCPLDE